MAFHHNRLNLLNDIIKAKDGYAVKRVGKKSPTFTEIGKPSKVVHLKFDQNNNLFMLPKAHFIRLPKVIRLPVE